VQWVQSRRRGGGSGFGGGFGGRLHRIIRVQSVQSVRVSRRHRVEIAEEGEPRPRLAHPPPPDRVRQPAPGEIDQRIRGEG
jgi:hypothetical protein